MNKENRNKNKGPIIEKKKDYPRQKYKRKPETVEKKTKWPQPSFKNKKTIFFYLNNINYNFKIFHFKKNLQAEQQKIQYIIIIKKKKKDP